jgi:hypothetical protein
MQNMKEKCKEYDEQLKHRFYKFTCSLRNTAAEVNESEDEEP